VTHPATPSTTLRVRARFAAVVAVLCLACSKDKSEPTRASAAPPAAAAPVRASLECVSVEAPAGYTKQDGNVGGLAFRGPKKLRAGGVEYDAAFTVATQAAEGSDANTLQSELMTSFTTDYARATKTAARGGGVDFAGLQAPRATPTSVAGQPGHSWQVDTIASFNGERLPWRAFSVTTVFKNRAYVVTAGAALANVAELKPLFDAYLASVRLDACK
jgi:hypothetical protein